MLKKPKMISKSAGLAAAKISKPNPSIRKRRNPGKSTGTTLPAGSDAKRTIVKASLVHSVTTPKNRLSKPVVTVKKKPISGNRLAISKESIHPKEKVVTPLPAKSIKSGSMKKSKLKNILELASKKQKSDKQTGKGEKNSTKRKLKKTENKARKLKKEIKKTKNKKGQKKKLKLIRKELAKVLKKLKLNRKKLKKTKK